MQFLIDLVLILVYFFVFFLICAWSWRFWMMYINQKFLHHFNAECIMLEIKLPREIMKSPLAMEIALDSLLQGGGVGNWYNKIFKGNLPAYSSVEIASLEGVIHFYVRIHKKFRPLVESNLYAQYPGIEISETDDYTKRIQYHHHSKDVYAWGATYNLAKTWNPTDPKTGEDYPDPKKPGDEKAKYSMRADFLPMKTYVDYGLDKDPKEEFKTDPITPLIEFMGNIGKGEYFWYQILVQDEAVYNGKNKMPKFFVNVAEHEHVSLRDMADARRKQIRTASHQIEGKTSVDEMGVVKMVDGKPDAEGKPTKVEGKYIKTKAVPKKEMDLTPEEKEEIEAITKKISKPLACVVIRLFYVAKKDNFHGEQIQNILAFQKPFNGRFNSLESSVTEPYNYPWENIGNRRVSWRTEEMFEEFVEREGFYPHIPKRKSFDAWEDIFFWKSSMKNRKIFRMVYEAIFYPFHHPQPSGVSVLNTEELATLWHLPGAVAGTPTLPRIDSTKGVAPVNLPQ